MEAYVNSKYGCGWDSYFTEYLYKTQPMLIKNVNIFKSHRTGVGV
jgi:hypothetical protein